MHSYSVQADSKIYKIAQHKGNARSDLKVGQVIQFTVEPITGHITANAKRGVIGHTSHGIPNTNELFTASLKDR